MEDPKYFFNHYAQNCAQCAKSVAPNKGVCWRQRGGKWLVACSSCKPVEFAGLVSNNTKDNADSLKSIEAANTRLEQIMAERKLALTKLGIDPQDFAGGL